MKIDEACIDHNIVQEIKNLLLCEVINDGESQWLIYNSGYIDGMNALADRLKEVLKA